MNHCLPWFHCRQDNTNECPFLPATKASPKEILPIVDKPLIQYAVEEVVAAGIEVMVFVTGRNKNAIPDHFDKAYELETELEARGKAETLGLV